jgi:hypothetical protein
MFVFYCCIHAWYLAINVREIWEEIGGESKIFNEWSILTTYELGKAH